LCKILKSNVSEILIEKVGRYRAIDPPCGQGSSGVMRSAQRSQQSGRKSARSRWIGAVRAVRRSRGAERYLRPLLPTSTCTNYHICILDPQTLDGPFSSVSTPILASKYVFCSIDFFEVYTTCGLFFSRARG